jgi:excisionase family DNA binding protein
LDNLLTVDEAARALRVTRGTMYRHIATGAVRAVRLGTGEKAPLRIEEGELERYTKASTIGDDIAIRAEQLVARRGQDPDDPNAYAEALRELGYEAEVFIDRTAKALAEDVEAAHRAAGHRTLGIQELAKLGDPLPVEISKLGPRGLGRNALRILSEKGVTEYDAAEYRRAIKQAIKEALSPKRTV